MSNERPYRLALLGTSPRLGQGKLHAVNQKPPRLGRGKLNAVNRKPPLPQRGRCHALA